MITWKKSDDGFESNTTINAEPCYLIKRHGKRFCLYKGWTKEKPVNKMYETDYFPVVYDKPLSVCIAIAELIGR